MVCFHSLLTVPEVLDKFHFCRLKTYFQTFFFFRTHFIFMTSSYKILASKIFLFQWTLSFETNDVRGAPCPSHKDSTILEKTDWLKPLPPRNFCKMFSNSKFPLYSTTSFSLLLSGNNHISVHLLPSFYLCSNFLSSLPLFPSAPFHQNT